MQKKIMREGIEWHSNLKSIDTTHSRCYEPSDGEHLRRATISSRVWFCAGIAVVIAAVVVLSRLTEQRASERATGTFAGDARNTQPEPGRWPQGRRSYADVGSQGQSPASNPTEPDERATAPRRMPPEILDECFRAEQRDEVWASAIEARMREFIARQPYGSTFHIASVECRATLCEIHASTDTPAELTDPQGPRSPATWQSLILNVRQDGKLAFEFEDDGLLTAARYGEHADYTATLVRRSSAVVHGEARCGGDDLEALRSRALKFVTGGMPADVAQGLPPLSEEIMGSPFKLAAYFEAEDRDETWAAAMEASIREALAAQPSTRAWKGTSIECQTTLCQVRASTDQAAADDFRKVVARITKESSNLGMTRVANGVTTDSQDPTQVVHVATLVRTR